MFSKLLGLSAYPFLFFVIRWVRYNQGVPKSGNWAKLRKAAEELFFDELSWTSYIDPQKHLNDLAPAPAPVVPCIPATLPPRYSVVTLEHCFGLLDNCGETTKGIVISLIVNDQFIEAVKEWKNCTGLSLLDAKQDLDRVRNYLRESKLL